KNDSGSAKHFATKVKRNSKAFVLSHKKLYFSLLLSFFIKAKVEEDAFDRAVDKGSYFIGRERKKSEKIILLQRKDD
ncbi:MAG TPA: hypothetical protein PK976_04205, partial [Bacteroidales bacterium]|nr:hypothetical protein [Bacteroidales bacterium]